MVHGKMMGYGYHCEEINVYYGCKEPANHQSILLA